MRRYNAEKDGKIWDAARKFLRNCDLYSPAYNEPAWIHKDGTLHMFVTDKDVRVTVYWFKQADDEICITQITFQGPED
tara:strand:+ start:612 stop:845 length:234 start_codon:yes stop_codon:yes gene_type:complete